MRSKGQRWALCVLWYMPEVPPRAAGARRRPAPEAGASLVELLLVVAIVGILGAVIFPGFGMAGAATARNQALALAAEIRLARQQAVARDRDCRVAVDPAAGRYQLICDDGYTPGPVTIPDGVTILSAPANPVRFRADGLLAAGAGSIRIQARRGGPVYQVQVRTGTGETILTTAP